MDQDIRVIAYGLMIFGALLILIGVVRMLVNKPVREDSRD